MKSRPWITLCVGVLIGVLISGVVFVGVQIGRGIATWGELQYYTDTDVRKFVKEAGIALPQQAYDIHYGLSGFVDSSLWIKFSVPKQKIWVVVADSISKSEGDFSPVFPQHLAKEIFQNPNQKFDLSWWNPTSVKSPKSWSNPKEQNGQHFFEDWLVDTETGTFYITRWDT